MPPIQNTPCKHPVVMLAGVNANDLESLLEFVYRGEVSVDHLQLPSLLQAAHCLKIQGLAPQTLTRDDYTTQIQLHPTMLAQNHVDNANSAEATQYVCYGSLSLRICLTDCFLPFFFLICSLSRPTI